MDAQFERLNLFFDRIKNVSFWQRIFSWRQMRSLSYEAYEEFRTLVAFADQAAKEINQLKEATTVLESDGEHFKSDKMKLENSFESLQRKLDTNEKELSSLKASDASKGETIRMSERKINDQQRELTSLREKLEQFTKDLSQVRQENAIFEKTKDDRRTQYETSAATLTVIREQIQNDRKMEQEQRARQKIERLESMKEMWAKHQEKVKNVIKMICERHTIEYVEKVPFKGSPDNSIKICDEFVVFDAKSPSSDDLKNFPSYIKTQTDSVKKYAKEENVRRDIFLVIPSNTVDAIEQFSYNMGDYNVYVVTLDVLEPLMLTLKKIEAYEFVEQLTPEERENVCRIIGKFAHMAKRRIQIDQFFAWELLDVLTKCKADLPREILEKVIEFEKSEKLNPPQERRAKQIPIAELESDTEKIRKEAQAKAVIFPLSLQKDLNKLPLYEGEEAV